ncbi:cell division protein FtsA [candidate division KSB1 bacterium]|nr:cell division protein FtsA [candidate division KSB1 bacterium]
MYIPKFKGKIDSPDILASLDIGTSKFSVVIAEASETGQITILGAGVAQSHGLRQGAIINLDQAVQAIRSAVQEAQLTAGIKISDVVVGIAGEHIHSVNSRGVVAVSRSNHEVIPHDVERVLDAARAIALPVDRKVLHVLPQEFIVDTEAGIKNPIGIKGVRLEAEVHIVTMGSKAEQNLIQCVNKADLNIIGLVLEPLASSLAVLSEEEREMGAALVDIGADNTELVVFKEGTIRHTAIIKMGGQNVTNDIALGLKTPSLQAESIKRQYGCTHPSGIRNGDTIPVPGLPGRQSLEVTDEAMMSIIRPRMEEILKLVHVQIQQSKCIDKLGTGVVLTGGGALLKGVDRLAEDIFGIPVKIGIPQGLVGLVESVSSPAMATGVGLIQYLAKHPSFEKEDNAQSDKSNPVRIWESIKKFYKDNF